MDDAPTAAGLSYPLTAPPFGEPAQVAPGVLWLRMPLPFGLDHVNLWLLEDEGGWTLVDSGLAASPVKELWRRQFALLLADGRARRLVVTHFHPDHMGLAGWLCGELGIELWTSEAGWLTARLVHLDQGPERRATRAAFYRGHGATEALVEGLDAVFGSYLRNVVAVPTRFRRLEDGQVLGIGGRDWRVIVGHGHAPAHVCLHCPSLAVLISGDQVLPRITTNVSVWDSEPDADPLGAYLASLRRLRALPAETLVLPSHGLPFRGLAARADALSRHHDQRLDDAVRACAEPRAAMELVPLLFRDGLDHFQATLALGEAIAHLNYLVHHGGLARIVEPRGAILFRQTG